MLAIFSGLSAVVLGLITSAITYSGGLVNFEASDKAAIDEGVGNGISNMWSGFQFLLPYIGTVLGILVVVGGVYLIFKKLSR